jgi:hypothetical protein
MIIIRTSSWRLRQNEKSEAIGLALGFHSDLILLNYLKHRQRHPGNWSRKNNKKQKSGWI